MLSEAAGIDHIAATARTALARLIGLAAISPLV
jgi:hypothetical protein